MTDSPPLADRLASVRAGVADAARAAGRDPSEITTVVVTKFQPMALIRDLYSLGVRDFGESRLQEVREKVDELDDLDSLRWHRRAAGRAPRPRARRAGGSRPPTLHHDPTARVVEVFLQVDLSGESGRGGAPEDEIPRLAELVAGAPSLRLAGVMAVAPLGVDPRAAFARLRRSSERVVAIDPTAVAISAGMSGDYAEAVSEGATHLRIGTAITGIRPPAA